MAKAKTKSKRPFWKADWFWGLAVVALGGVFHQSSVFVDRLELAYYDFALRSADKEPSPHIAIVAIDDTSIQNVGRWPWPRATQAKLIDVIAAGKPKVIANSVLLSEPEINAAQPYLEKIRELSTGDTGVEVRAVAEEGLGKINGDAQLAESQRKAGNVVGFATLLPEPPIGRPDAKLASHWDSSLVKGRPGFSVAGSGIVEPIPALSASLIGLGIGNKAYDVDGAVRVEALFGDYFGQTLPSFTLRAVAAYLNLTPADIQIAEDDSVVKIGRLQVATDDLARMRMMYYRSKSDDKSAFPSVSAYDLLAGKANPAALSGKLVVLATTAAGLGTEFPSPLGGSGVTAAEITAHTASSILAEHFIKTPWWAQVPQALALFLVAGYLMFALPRLAAKQGAIATAGFFAVLMLAGFLAVSKASIWVQLVLPATLLLLGHLALTTKRFLVTEQGKERSEAESAETNRMMGLALQGQGRLDEAFDRYRRVPLNETHGAAAMENMYNLALDFERKRQFNKAQAVYEYMSGYDKDFKDLEAKLKRAKNLSETVILGGGGSHPGGTILLGDGSVEKPMLGRYQVEKELGKGAMGVVYLGKDPKIQRVVAIKTMALAQEFEGEELDDARERFFREAETAGRLQHPNIVTIYDAGEEHELAYIAMEFLKGRDLVDYTKDGALFPPALVASITARVAEALAYAHQQNVVHRDIKPANIMYEPNADIVKVTDFGIARITDSSKTKTGLVLGTPSFMSPEQIAGKKVDGRSDLYSLGVMLFQMLTGALPFRGESMAELMYKIANEEAIDIRKIKPRLPEQLANIVALSLSKRPETRYQDGAAFAKDLRAVAAELSLLPDTPAGANGGFAGSATESDKTAVMNAPANFADEKTAVLGARPTDGFDKTAVSRPGVGGADFDKTEVFNRAEPPKAAVDGDPFAKTLVSPPPGVRNSGQQ